MKLGLLALEGVGWLVGEEGSEAQRWWTLLAMKTGRCQLSARCRWTKLPS